MNSSTERWHVSKAVDIGNVLAIISLVIGGFIFVNKFDQRLTTLEIVQRNIIEKQQFQLGELKEDIEYIRERIDKLSEK